MTTETQRDQVLRNRAEAAALIANPPPLHPCVLQPAPDRSGVTADGAGFVVGARDRAAFARDGFVVLPGVMSEEEMARDVDPVFFGFFRGEEGCVAPGRDTCDMGQPTAAAAATTATASDEEAGSLPPLAAERCALFNVMLPRLYYAGKSGKGLVGGVLERRCASIASQLRGWGPGGGAMPAQGAAAASSSSSSAKTPAVFCVDFDQILSKRPPPDDSNNDDENDDEAERSRFDWHQDAAYWPPLREEEEGEEEEGQGEGGPRPAAAPRRQRLNLASLNCWLAVSEASEAHGCMRYIPGTHREEVGVRPHVPVGGSRDASHAIRLPPLSAEEEAAAVAAPARRGDLVVHHERVVHCSPANRVAGEWRHAYVLGMRTPGCVAAERRAGFDHSHNGGAQWDTFAVAVSGGGGGGGGGAGVGAGE